MGIAAIATVAETVGAALETSPATADDIGLEALVTGKLTVYAACRSSVEHKKIKRPGRPANPIVGQLAGVPLHEHRASLHHGVTLGQAWPDHCTHVTLAAILVLPLPVGAAHDPGPRKHMEAAAIRALL
jgi:hypothetical protein